MSRTTTDGGAAAVIPERPDYERLRAEVVRGAYPFLPEDEGVLFARAEWLEATLKRAAFIAEHLHAMIDQDTWRNSGGDDGQGHYEGDHHAEQVAEEIRSWTK